MRLLATSIQFLEKNQDFAEDGYDQIMCIEWELYQEQVGVASWG